jgi:hypothetical protein
MSFRITQATPCFGQIRKVPVGKANQARNYAEHHSEGRVRFLPASHSSEINASHLGAMEYRVTALSLNTNQAIAGYLLTEGEKEDKLFLDAAPMWGGELLA